MFYLAEAFLDREGLTLTSHAVVIGELGRIFAKSGPIPAESHRYLIEASEERLGGEYEDVYVLSAKPPARGSQQKKSHCDPTVQAVLRRIMPWREKSP